ncbi:MAG: VWA domain-containing protein, partial [Planctomycetota bacterium]
KRLIETLHQHDHFQLLAFDNSLESPPNRRFKNIETDGWIPASSGNKSAAIAWLNGIGARGGTEMEMALNAALQCFANRSSRSHPQPSHPSKRDANAIVLITDGHVTGEDAVLQTLHSLPESNRPRLFALGIDRAVNASVLRRLSDATGGMSELVESQPRMRDVIDTFSSKIGAPMLTDFALTDSTGRQLDESLVVAPPLSNTALFAGQSVTLFARGAIDSIDDWTLSASNHSGDRQRFSLGRRPAEDAAFDNTKPDSSAANPNSDAPETNRMASATCLPLRAMWGRQRVRMLEDRYVVQAMESDESEREAMREQIVNTSLTSGVLCRYTAFVAVDQIVRHAPGQSPHSVTQAIEVPEGWQWQVTPRIPPGSRVSMS